MGDTEDGSVIARHDDVDDVAHREFHVAIAVLAGLAEYQRQRQTPDPGVERMTAHDSTMSDALDLVERLGQPDGTWKLQNQHRGRVWFELETPGRPSRWNTLRALWVLQTYGRADHTSCSSRASGNATAARTGSGMFGDQDVPFCAAWY